MKPRRLPEIDGVELRLVEGRGDEAFQSNLFELLSEDERARARRFKVEHARAAFVVSRGILRNILGTVLECAPASLLFGEGEHGKPYLTGAHAGGELEFNVSHSGDLTLYAISRGRELGVDIELNKPNVEVEALARRFFAPGEARQLLDEAPTAERLDNFYRCWTRKEAYLKARGTGLTTRLDAFEVSFLPDVTPALRHTEIAGEDPSVWRMFEVPVPNGYTAALVAHS